MISTKNNTSLLKDGFSNIHLESYDDYCADLFAEDLSKTYGVLLANDLTCVCEIKYPINLPKPDLETNVFTENFFREKKGDLEWHNAVFVFKLDDRKIYFSEENPVFNNTFEELDEKMKILGYEYFSFYKDLSWEERLKFYKVILILFKTPVLPLEKGFFIKSSSLS